jgi:radical SAM protein with 4Fe4S-binding SPASM domain
MNSNNFCYAPWSTLEILPDGSILPCCKFVDGYYDEQFNITKHDVSEYQNSRKLIAIKQEFLDGKWPRGCERCEIEERNNIKSKRQLDYIRWQPHYDQYNINSGELLNLSIALGNVCNLKCLICAPGASSRWRKEWREIYNIDVPSIEKFRRGIVHKIVDQSPNLVHIDIHGGEPFLSAVEDHRALLDGFIESGQASEISIHYTTNGTVWPEPEWFDRWKHFREIDLQISIDGVGPRYEYLRYPAKWTDLTQNVQRYIKYEHDTDNFRLSVAHVVSAHNVFYVDEFITWCYNIGLPTPWLSKLHKPHYYRPTVWPKEVKDLIVKQLATSQWPEVGNWISLLTTTDESEFFGEFCEHVKQHDQYRGLDFKNAFPEMAKFL